MERITLEDAISNLELNIRWIEDNSAHHFAGWLNVTNAMRDALELLKEQNEQKKQIMKAVWDVLHEGVSTDTVADQDWVYEQIRNRVEKTY